jgi:hypothetical protein
LNHLNIKPSTLNVNNFSETQKSRLISEQAFFSYLKFKSGGFLLSHTGNGAVSSAPVGLTSVFGMGTGVTLPTKPPENLKDQKTFD